jgi:hypothetical protein
MISTIARLFRAPKRAKARGAGDAEITLQTQSQMDPVKGERATAEPEDQLCWQVVVHGEASPRRRFFDEGWLSDSTISDNDVVCCNSSQTGTLSIADTELEFSSFPDPAMSILILVPRRTAPELSQRRDDDVRSFVVSIGFLRAFQNQIVLEIIQSTICFTGP